MTVPAAPDPFRPDQIVIVDWSAANAPSPARASADAIWIGTADVGSGDVCATYHRTRAEAMAALHARVTAALATGRRVLIGADFPFAYPAGFAAALTGKPLALALWDWLAGAMRDAPDNRNNRFALAAAINARFPGVGPFWGRPAGLQLPDLPDKGRLRHGHGLPERRAVEQMVPSAQPCWKLYTTGSVGSQALTGIARLARLRAAFPGKVSVWPFEPCTDARVMLAEVYPSLLAREVAALLPAAKRGRFEQPIKDAVQVRLLAATLGSIARAGQLPALLAPQHEPEVLAEQGWILGAGHVAMLRAAASALADTVLAPQ